MRQCLWAATVSTVSAGMTSWQRRCCAIVIVLVISAHTAAEDADEAMHPEDVLKLQQEQQGSAPSEKTCRRDDAACLKSNLPALLAQKESCLQHITGNFSQVQKVQAAMQADLAQEDERAQILLAQTVNMQAQNQRLVAELTRLQQLGSENDGLQHSMRKMTTDHDHTRARVESLAAETRKLQEELDARRREATRREERCEDNLALLKDAYFENNLRFD